MFWGDFTSLTQIFNNREEIHVRKWEKKVVFSRSVLLEDSFPPSLCKASRRNLSWDT